MFKLYRNLEREEQFVIYADPSEGRDFCAAVACSKKHADFPFVFNAQVKSSQFGYELHKMAKFIHRDTNYWPTIGVERNMGQATIHVLNTLNYQMMYRMTYFDSSTQKRSEKMGFQMTEASRAKMLDDFALAIKQKIVRIYDKETYNQMQTFVYRKRTVGSPIKAQAETGCNDDLLIACYSDDTEVLTTSGWKLIQDVEVGEWIPSLNLKTGKVEVAHNTETINRPYHGKMIRFSSRSIDFLVTPNHRMVVRRSLGANKYSHLQIDRADNLVGKHFRLNKFAEWEGEKRDTWSIPSYKPSKYHKERKRIVFAINDFMSLLGFYIAEGYYRISSREGGRIAFCQRQYSKGFKPFKELLDKMGLSYTYNGFEFTLYNTQIARYFASLVPGNVYNKHIPREILNLHPDHLSHLYKFMVLGDGCNDKHYVTVSSRLKDDFIELVAKLGYYATWTKRAPMDGGSIEGRVIKGRVPTFFISIGKKNLQPRLNHHKKTHTSVKDYNGRITCLSLNKNHTMYVRRNGTTMWSGNTAGAYQLYLTVPLQFTDEDSSYNAKKEREKWRFK